MLQMTQPVWHGSCAIIQLGRHSYKALQLSPTDQDAAAQLVMSQHVETLVAWGSLSATTAERILHCFVKPTVRLLYDIK